MTVTPREIGEPERRGAVDGFPFRYQPAYAGNYGSLNVVVINDRTEEDVSNAAFGGAGYTVTMTGGVISSPNVVANTLQVERVYRVHFLFQVGGVPYDEYRRVVIEK